MQTMLYASEWAGTSCAARQFQMFWFGPFVGFALWIMYVIRFRNRMVPYLWILPLTLGLLIEGGTAIARTTTDIYLEDGDIVQDACRFGKVQQERAPVTAARSTVLFARKGNTPFLDVYWPKQPFALDIPLNSGSYLANVRDFAPEQIDEYVKGLKAKGRTVPDGLE